MPFSTRLLFIGLWTLADREGRLEDRVRKIKMAVFPADEVDVESGLQELHDARLIIRYRIEGKALIQVVNFTKHQTPHIKESASTLPAPGEYGASIGQAHLNPESPLLKEERGKREAPPPETTFTPGRWGEPSVVLFEEIFGFKTASGFASSVASRVQDLSLWKTLLENKRAYADKPLAERKRVCNWILDEYDKRVEEKKNGKRNSNKRTDADVLAESADFYANYDSIA